MLPQTNGIMRIHTKELRYANNGNAILKLNCVSSNKYKTQSGEQKEDTCWIECVSFGKQAETINNFFNEKDRIYIQGALKQDSWEAQDGSKRSKHTITIEKFDFIEKRDNQQSQQQSNSYQPQGQQYQQPAQDQQGIEYPDDDSIPFAPLKNTNSI